MYARLKSGLQDESGTSVVEAAMAMLTFLVILFGVVDFSYAFYQWNAATKAVQYGARLAAVSNPVANDLMTMTGLGGSVHVGDPMPTFVRVCTSSTASGSSGTCTSNNSYTAAAMRRIVFGATSRTACATPASTRDVGMCNLFGRIQASDVVIKYEYTGLGYAGRPCGPVPTVTVSLRPTLQYDYVFLSSLANLPQTVLPALTTTVTGEDLNTSGGAC